MEKKKSNRSQILGLEPGQQIAFPASMCASIRAMASDLGFAQGRKYTTSRDVENAQIVVTRIS